MVVTKPSVPKPVSIKMAKIPFKKINLGKAYRAIRPLLDSGYIGLGNTVFEFEEKLARYVGARYVVATDSCTSAIFLSLKYEKDKGLSRVSIPSMTVPLVANACFEAGVKIRFNGQTDWVGSAYQLLGSHIYDSAHELRRNQYRKLSQHDPAAKVCYSFYPTKTIGSADGGAIATNDADFAAWARCISTYGRDQKAKYANSWDYDTIMLGYKRHYTNLQAAICLEQLARLDETNARRRRIVEQYNRAFNLKNTSDYLYRINMPNRDGFINFAREVGIECGVHFKPLHLMTPFKSVPMGKTDRRTVEAAYQATVSLPLYDTLKKSEVDRVIRVVKQYESLFTAN